MGGQWQELDAFLAPLQVAKRQLVLFALNNNTDSTAANGGSHWQQPAGCVAA
ncbi:hypothetical protein HaLaN_04623 [Haematococcus lacustris]|uniref:Uncharacterized protein n=1 Tax=Haematococcus lacustris TaxID=44745 RepID=A0A699YRR3_HAELA|nr:hypothetical protein HaLaN_04623 [Haematococcus lacustris]